MSESFYSKASSSPIQQHHFTVEFGSLTRWKEWEVKSVTMPQIEVSEGAYRMGNHIYKYPGQQRWNDITITIVDTGRAVDQLKGQLKTQGYSWESGGGMFKDRGVRDTVVIKQHRTVTTPLDNVTATPKKKGFLAKLGFSRPEPKGGPGFVMAEANRNGVMDGGGGFHFGANTWTLKGAWIKSINFGTHDYYSDELITMEIVVTYDYAEIDTTGEERHFLGMATELPKESPKNPKRAQRLSDRAANAEAKGNTKRADRLRNKAKDLNAGTVPPPSEN